MTIPELELVALGRQKALQEHEQSEWERTRWLACCMLQPHAKKGRKLKPSDLMKFPWDKKEKETTADEMMKLLK
tara:strand:+ start:216 stop:437 length:222 start_codon:yes stop_codon:yes gene_type:complete